MRTGYSVEGSRGSISQPGRRTPFHSSCLSQGDLTWRGREAHGHWPSYADGEESRGGGRIGSAVLEARR